MIWFSEADDWVWLVFSCTFVNFTFLRRQRRFLNYWIMWFRLRQEASADGALAGRSMSCLKSTFLIPQIMKYWAIRTDSYLLSISEKYNETSLSFWGIFFSVFKHPTRCLEKEKEVFPLLLSICLHIPLRLNYLICEVLFSLVRLLCVFYTISVWPISTFKLSKVFYFNYLTSGL